MMPVPMLWSTVQDVDGWWLCRWAPGTGADLAAIEGPYRSRLRVRALAWWRNLACS